jgi:hypothetical protein
LATGPLLQLALIVVDDPTDGEAGFAVGAQAGTPVLPPTQVTVCVGGVPDTTKLLQLGFVYVNVAAVANGDTVNETSANNAEDSGTDRRANAKESWIFTTVSPSECKGRTQKPSSLYIASRREQPVGDKHASLRRRHPSWSRNRHARGASWRGLFMTLA